MWSFPATEFFGNGIFRRGLRVALSNASLDICESLAGSAGGRRIFFEKHPGNKVEFPRNKKII
jgi:hypothetical protein